jgi:glycosyltransferase involved in cell wall biosynthesis
MHDVELVIVGSGPMQEHLVQKVKNSCLEEKIHFLGSLPNPFPVLKKASAVILPSLSEALPTIILESFIFGKTVISTPTMGAIDLLEGGRLGYVSDTFSDPKEFSKCIESGLNSPVTESKLRLKVEEFRINHKIPELVKLF